jgi:hypothetical protein
MATVTQLLDALATHRLSLDDVAAEFRRRTWPARVRATDAQAFGVEDEDAPDPDSWAAVEADSRLTAEQYVILAVARKESLIANRNA